MKFSDLKRNDIWQKWHNTLSHIQINKKEVCIKNIRDMNHVTLEEKYHDKKYNLDTLVWVNLISVPFGLWKMISHLMLEYKFENKDSVVLSIEARRTQGEKFSPFKWFFKHYGLIYIWGTYNDLIGLRKDIRKNKVFIYPLKLTQGQMKRSFLFFAEKTNKLIDTPRYYNTFFSNCSSNLWDVFSIRKSGTPKKSYHLILNSKIPVYLKKLWYIDTK